MSYDLKIYRNEVRENSSSLDFLENEETVLPFSEKQNAILRKRLKHYKYELESKNDLFEEYNYDGGKLGISALLTNNCLTFRCAGGSQDGLFEIIQTASEFSDGDLSVLNLQEGTWENQGETFKVGQPPNINSTQEVNANIKKETNNLTKDKPKSENNSPWWKFW